ncbi:MAG: phenylalanine--tRNA ligase subunit beta [Patescibacteria group bacterium]
MKLSYRWLKEIVSGLKISPEKLAEVLTLQVANVEKIERSGQGLDKVRVAEILEIKPHPHADRLQIVKVKTIVNSQLSILNIVCGAPNIKVGQKVPLALPGAKLPNGVKIKESIIRGITSAGMLCAEDELGIGSDHTGIYILPNETNIGEPITKVLGLNDTILEVENKSLTHRPDLFSHIGFAREIAAITNGKFKIQNSKFEIHKRKSTNLNIKVEDFRLCPRYMAIVMDEIKIAPSPLWLQNRLRNLGIRPINNVVDITNYVLVEYGQPLHAFDYNKIAGRKIIIRSAKNGEKILALDGKEYELNDKDLVIADSRRPIALAGVMGGELFSITPETKTIVIESANFEPVTIRRTSWRLGLRTESALRFEKGLPINFPELGLYRAIELIQELGGGKVASQIYDLKSKEAIKKLKQAIKINFDPERAKKFIGLEIADKLMLKILINLGCQVKRVGKKYRVIPPISRPDLNLFEDLVEEIVRIYGLDKIVSRPIGGQLKPVEYEPGFILERELRNILVGCGFDEVCNYSFALRLKTESNLKEQQIRGGLEIVNPLNPEQKYLRVSLLPGLVKNAEKNGNYFEEFKIFEIGKIFFKSFISNEVEQPKHLAGLIYKDSQDIYFEIKGIIELILNKLNIMTHEARPFKIDKLEKKSPTFYIDQLEVATEIIINNQFVGYFGLLKPEIIELKTKKQIGFFEIDLEKLLPLVGGAKKYQPISIYPPIKRDLAFLIDKKINWQKIFETTKNINPLIKQVELFDVFEDKKFGEKRNLAFHIVYQAEDRTLKTEEVDKIQQKIISILKEKFDAELRNF